VRRGENDAPAAAANNAYQQPASQEAGGVASRTHAGERVARGAAAGMLLLPVGGWRRGGQPMR